MDPEINELGTYTPVHAGSISETSHPAAPVSSTGDGAKMDEILYLLRSMSRTVEEIKRDVDVLRLQATRHP